MGHSVIAHLVNQEPIEGEIDELPTATAMLIPLRNPKRRSNRELEWLDHRTTILFIATSHLVSLEVMLPRSDEDRIITKYYGSSGNLPQ